MDRQAAEERQTEGFVFWLRQIKNIFWRSAAAWRFKTSRIELECDFRSV
jgi:hypothetical protein